ncbi:MAG: AAA family ATPase [Acetobacteraceae bacterium]|nr:AAA family ATPase [Acetobacteraceae bacterium]
MPVIAFTSPKGGVGKTTLAAHVAALLARRGHRVVALDLDPQNALRLHLGLPLREEEGLFTDLSRPWRQSLRETPAGVGLLPYGTVEPRRAMENAAALLDNPELLAAIARDVVADPATILVLDSPPGPTPPLAALLPLVDVLAVVLLADAGSAAMLPLVASGRVLGRGTLASRVAGRLAVVLNQVDLDSPLSKAVLDGAARMLGDRLIGAVARDEALAEALADKRLLLSPMEGGAAEDLHALADAIAARLPASPAAPPATRRRGGYSALSEWGLDS